MDIIGSRRKVTTPMYKHEGPIRLGHTMNGVPMTYDLLENPKGWIEAKEFVPKEFILKILRVRRGGTILHTTIIGWWTGADWDGFRLKKGDEVIQWKCKEDENDSRTTGKDKIGYA